MTGKKHTSGLFFFLSFFVSVTLATIGGVNAQNPSSSISNIKLPPIYQNKLDDFLANNNVMKDNDAKTFTTNFVEKEMEADWGISKENQLLFIRHSIYKQVTDQDLYDGKDGNQKIAEDFNNRGVSIRIRVCGQRYKDGIIAYMNELSAEARQRSAEADRRSAEADRRSAEADRRSAEADRRSTEALTSSLENLIRFYNRYKKDPSTIKDEELTRRKEDGKRVIQGCKELGIDYKAKLSPEMLKFYGVE